MILSKTANIDSADAAKALTSAIKGYRLEAESASEKMNSNAKSFMTLGRVETLDDTIGGIEAVTTDEINECISGYFNLADCSMSLVGNTKEADIPEIKRIRANTKRKIN